MASTQSLIEARCTGERVIRGRAHQCNALLVKVSSTSSVRQEIKCWRCHELNEIAAQPSASVTVQVVTWAS